MSDHGKECSHHHHHHSNQGNILIAFFLNFGFSLVEFVGGYLTNSVAIYSDALHDLGDSLALLFSYFAEKISKKNADAKFTFGYGRFSVMAALANGLILLIGSLFVMSEAIQRLQHPEAVRPEGMVFLAIFGVGVNGFAALRLSKNSGSNSKMLMFHLLEDILGWCAVLVVSIILLFRPWFFLDSVLSIMIALIIINGVTRSLYSVSKILMQAFPEGLKREELIQALLKMEHVIDVHFLQGWSVDDSKFNLTLHVKVSSDLKVRDVDSLRLNIEKFLQHKDVVYSTIQFEGDHCDHSHLQER